MRSLRSFANEFLLHQVKIQKWMMLISIISPQNFEEQQMLGNQIVIKCFKKEKKKKKKKRERERVLE